MRAQICETCEYRYEECYCSVNSTCKDYKADAVIFNEKNKYNNNLKLIEELKVFNGGDNDDVPVHGQSLNDMKFIIEQCKKLNIPQPDIYPWIGGDGVQAEWEYDWYLEIDSCDKGVSILFVKGKDYDNTISTKVSSVKDSLLLVKEFLTHVVNLKGTR